MESHFNFENYNEGSTKLKKQCRDQGSNQGPSDLQSDALPTELSRLGELAYYILENHKFPLFIMKCSSKGLTNKE